MNNKCWSRKKTFSVIIEGACLEREREESDAILPDRSVQRHSVTSLETACALMAKGPSWRRGLREKYVFCVPQELQRLLYLFCQWKESVGGA